MIWDAYPFSNAHQIPEHKTGDEYGRKRCAHSFANKGQSAKAIAKRRKARKLRKRSK